MFESIKEINMSKAKEMIEQVVNSRIDEAKDKSKKILIAYLKKYSSSKIKDIYDRDDFPSDALADVMPNFEYPDWDYQKAKDMIDYIQGN